MSVWKSSRKIWGSSMRLETDTLPEPFIIRRCETCGKEFMPAPYHQYKIGLKKYYCSYSCENSRQTNKRGNKPRKVGQYTEDGQLIQIYDDAYAGAEAVFGNAKCIRYACIGQRATYLGYVWKYEEE